MTEIQELPTIFHNIKMGPPPKINPKCAFSQEKRIFRKSPFPKSIFHVCFFFIFLGPEKPNKIHSLRYRVLFQMFLCKPGKTLDNKKILKIASKILKDP